MELYTKDLCVRFATRSGDIPAVNHVSLAFSERQVTGIIGETGSGKSVLGLSILGLLQSNASVTGQIFLGERELTALSERELCTVRGREIALVAQNPATSLNPSVRVGRQIEEVFRLAGKSTPDCRRLTLELLRQMAFSDPKQIAGAYPFELSGGMRQRVLTAIAVAARPQWLIADEPTKGLDAVVRNQVYDTFCMVRDQYRVGFIVITHDLLLARKFCERIVVMYCGRVLETNAARELFEHPRHPYTQGLIASLPHLGMKPMAGFSPAFTDQPSGCVFHPRCPYAEARCRHTEPKSIPCGAIATLEVQHLSKSFHSNRLRGRTHKAVDDVSLAIGPGQTYGLMGESGCGKSTLGRMITRLLPASSGTVLYDGTDLLDIPQRKMLPYRRRIQMLFQHPDTSLNPRMTVLDSLREPFLLHDLPGKQDMDEIIRAHIEPYGIQPELLERRASQVSGGQIQRIVLARIMLLQPEFIVLDEPTSMLDVSVQAQIMDLLHQVQLRTGVSYLLISHDLDLLRHASSRIGIMYRGKLLEQGETEAVLNAPTHPYTRELIENFSYMRD